MRQRKALSFLLVLLVVAGVIGVLYLVGHSARDDKGGRMKDIDTARSDAGATEPLPPGEDAYEAELDAESLRFVDEELEKRRRPADLVKLIEGWDNDAAYEADLISRETFAETLQNTADFDQNYYRLVFGNYSFSAAQSGNLKMIAMSRRFAKLVEEMRNGGPSPEQVNELLTRLRNDLSKLRGMKAKNPEFSRSLNWVGTGHDPALEDQSDLPMALGYRLNVSEMLIGQFGIHEGLPLLLESLDTRDGTLIKNWTSVAYACDKILSAEPPRGLTQGQHQVREEYLKWKATLPERSSDSSRELRYFDQQRFFKYERAELPSYRSLRRRHERATAMGAPVDHVSYGTVIIEIPPEGSDGWEIAMRQPRPPVDIVAFARRFLEAGQST